MSRSQCHRPPSHRSRNSERWMSGGDVGSVLVSGEGKAVNSERAGGAAGACNHQQSCYCHSPQSKVGVLLMMLPPKKHSKQNSKQKGQNCNKWVLMVRGKREEREAKARSGCSQCIERDSFTGRSSDGIIALCQPCTLTHSHTHGTHTPPPRTRE